MKKIIILILILISMIFSQNGGYSGSNIRIGMGATGQALGNVGVANFNPDPSSVYYNPALLTQFKARSVEFGLNLLSLDRQFLYVAFVSPLRGTASIGAYYIKSGVSNINERDNTGEVLGEIENSFHAVEVVFAKDFGKISFGFGMKLMYELMHFDIYNYSGQGVAIDLGALYHLRDDLWIGAQIKDINGKLESNTEDIYEGGQTQFNKFPILYKIGGAWQISKQTATLYYDFERSSQGEIKHHLGVESVPIMKSLRLRAGLENVRFTAGFGVTFKLWDSPSSLNYVFLPSVVDEGDSHAFSWVFRF